MVGWHHSLDGHEFKYAPGDSEGQGSLAFYSPWGCKEADMTELMNNSKVLDKVVSTVPSIQFSLKKLFLTSFAAAACFLADCFLGCACPKQVLHELGGLGECLLLGSSNKGLYSLFEESKT